MKNKRKYEDSQPATAAQVAAKKLKKLKTISKPDRPVVVEIKHKVGEFIENRKHANNLVDLLGHLDVSEPGYAATAAIHGVKRIFSHCLDNQQIRGKPSEEFRAKQDPESQYMVWLWERYEESVRKVCDLTHHPKPRVAHLALVTVINLLRQQNTRHRGATAWQEDDTQLFNLLILSLVSTKKSGKVGLGRFQEFLSQYTDIKFQTLARLAKIVVTATKTGKTTAVFLENVISCMETFQMIGNDEKGNSVSSFLCCNPETGASSYKLDLDTMKKNFGTVWLEILKGKLSLDQYKRVLILLGDKVMPFLPRPLLLTDFLLSSYAVGGSISMLALSGVFTLMTKHNLEYPDFYTKLYALFTPEVLTVKYKARFFHLSDVFLSSTHLPEYLVAAFTKRLARISLQSPANTLDMIIRFIHNLMYRHRGLSKLIDSPDRHDIDSDPYDPTESDPAKSKAVESSLWEIKTLASHILPQVSTAAKDLLEKGVRETEKDVSACLEITWADLIQTELKKKVFVNVPLNYDPPVGLKLHKNELLSEIFTLS